MVSHRRSDHFDTFVTTGNNNPDEVAASLAQPPRVETSQ
jgi:hypothetical protein